MLLHTGTALLIAVPLLHTHSLQHLYHISLNEFACQCFCLTPMSPWNNRPDWAYENSRKFYFCNHFHGAGNFYVLALSNAYQWLLVIDDLNECYDQRPLHGRQVPFQKLGFGFPGYFFQRTFHHPICPTQVGVTRWWPTCVVFVNSHINEVVKCEPWFVINLFI